MVLLIDNYDSFSFNLYQLVGSIDPDIKVIRSDELPVEEIRALSYAKQVMHGKQSVAKQVHPSKILKGLPEQFEVARYHSLAIIDETMPSELIVTSITDDGEVMSVEHKDYPIYGVQFHPESIMTPDGEQMIRNFLEK